jgi:probable rRNA maturation factor
MSATPRRKPSREPDLLLAVQYGVRSGRLPTRAKFRKWARAALGRKAIITLRVVGAREARRLNRVFRGRDYATNVLSFAYRDRGPLEGDIAICAPVLAREARERGVSREAHFAHLTVHGVLHLQGHDHLRRREARRMEQLEIRILAGLGYPDPYGAGKMKDEGDEG